MSATLNGVVRDKLGSRFSRILRKQGRIPASVQGEEKDHVHFSIDRDEFLSARRHHEHLFDIELDRGDTETALVRELHWGPFSEEILHVEFRRVVRGQKTEVEVDIDFLGHPKGGVLNHLLTHVTVLALPSEIPDRLEVKVDSLEEGDTILAKDLELPEGVELALDPETPVANAAAVKAEEPAAEEGEEDAAAAAEAPAPAAPSPEE